jgi:flagellar biosynthetic protein FliP
MTRREAAGLLVVLTLCASPSLAAGTMAPSLLGSMQSTPGPGALSPNVKLLVELSLLSFIPTALIAMTSFTRIIITLSFLRHALGMPETPPNPVLLTLALFLTFFTMAPTLERCYQQGVEPYLSNKITTTEGLTRSLAPLKTFMMKHIRPQDLQSVGDLAKTTVPDDAQQVPLRLLTPAFMLSELRASFVAGFVIFLPFLLIDLIVAAVLMALGMMMVPPVSISLPLKVMLFVLIDGWSLLMRAIAGAYT